MPRRTNRAVPPQENEPEVLSRVLVFDNYISSDRIYTFNPSAVKSDCWQVEIEGLIPCYRVTLCETAEELEAV